MFRHGLHVGGVIQTMLLEVVETNEGETIQERVIRILYDHYPSALSAVHASTSSARTGALTHESFFPFTLSLSKGEWVWMILNWQPNYIA